MAATQALYDELLDSWRKAVLLGSVQSQLGWDEQTYLPPGGAAHRADQMSLLAGMVHQQLTCARAWRVDFDPRNGRQTGRLQRRV